MPKTKRINQKFAVNYEPLELGREEGIQPGVQGIFETVEEAQEAAKACHRWFNEPTILEAAEDAESGRTVMVKRHQKVKNVRIWIEKQIDGDAVGDVPCEEKLPEKAQRPDTGSTRAVSAAG